MQARWFGLFRVRSPLLAESLTCFLFLQVLRWFTSLRCLPPAYGFSRGYIDMTRCGLPHSDIFGSKLVCSSPKLFAACHVLHRLLAPRHSPYTLSSLTIRNSKLTRTDCCIQSACDSSLQHCLCCGRKKLPCAEYSVVKDQMGAKPPSPRLGRSWGPKAPLRSLAREPVFRRRHRSQRLNESLRRESFQRASSYDAANRTLACPTSRSFASEGWWRIPGSNR